MGTKKWLTLGVGLLIFVVLAPVIGIGGLLLVAVVVGGEADYSMTQACSVVDAEGTVINDEQRVVVSAISDVASELNLGSDAVLIAITTALAESQAKNWANDGTFNYHLSGHAGMSYSSWLDAARVVKASMNYPHDHVGRDWDSVGPFQQRPSAGWGTVEQLMDPVYQARAFFGGPTGPNNGSPRGLLDTRAWQDMGIAQAAQSVQISAFPDAYNRYIGKAKEILATIDTSVCLEYADVSITAEGFTHPLPAVTYLSSRFGQNRSGYTHMGDDLPAPAGTPIFAAADGTVVDSHCNFAHGRSPCQIRINHGGGAETLYVHMYPSGVLTHRGERVSAGQHIANVGSNGNSSGPHLHLEVWINGQPTNPYQFFASRGIDLANP